MAGSGAHQPQAARALGACLRRLSLLAAGCRAPAGSARSAPLFVKLRPQDRLAAAWNLQGCAEPLPPKGCGERHENGREPGTRDFACKPGRLACTSGSRLRAWVWEKL